MKKQILPLIIALIPILVVIYFYPDLPEKIPGHYNFKGEVDRYDPKWTAFITAALGLIIYGVMLFIRKYDPKGRISAMGSKFDNLALWLTILFSMFSLLIIGSAISKISTENMFTSLNLFIGILFLILGNYMTSMKPNYFIGIRTPWTLESEEVWKKTHVLAGRLFFITGFILVILCFLPFSAEWKNKAFLSLVIVSSVIPLVYSFFIYKKLG
ncbi:MAG: SdpI family protein [Chitinophagales bacterium]|nr:SdpI family protein [Chitinophagales bacterium]